MKLIPSILLVFSIVPAVNAGDLDAASRKTLLDHLNRSSTEFADSIKGVTAEQWNYKPTPEVWSIAECAEHIALTEDLLRGMIENKVLSTPATPEKVAERKTGDSKVLAMITDRSTKAKAPEVLKPTRQFATPADALNRFNEGRSKTVMLAKSNNELREHAIPHQVLKTDLDAYQWLLYLSGHTMRHTAQINEVKASAGYPK